MNDVEKRHKLGATLFEVFRSAFHGMSRWDDLTEFEQQVWVKIAQTALEEKNDAS